MQLDEAAEKLKARALSYCAFVHLEQASDMATGFEEAFDILPRFSHLSLVIQ